jgi:hypothetical protein
VPEALPEPLFYIDQPPSPETWAFGMYDQSVSTILLFSKAERESTAGVRPTIINSALRYIADQVKIDAYL